MERDVEVKSSSSPFFSEQAMQTLAKKGAWPCRRHARDTGKLCREKHAENKQTTRREQTKGTQKGQTHT